MPLPLKLKRYTFAICFGISVLPFVALNLVMYIAAAYGSNGHSATEAGFPLKWYVSNWVFRGVIWEAFVIDVMLVFTVAAISAKILKSILHPNDLDR
ncbi:MAG TPA: hypothetical protein VFR78_08450 [Pyrinomonadaceae bacterium]|nr:hypothetical protein [Pyrinomonadaceae bacterium]